MEYYKQPEDIDFEFYEQVDATADDRYTHHEKLDYREDEGLSEDGVQKLSDDFFNPMPTNDDEK